MGGALQKPRFLTPSPYALGTGATYGGREESQRDVLCRRFGNTEVRMSVSVSRPPSNPPLINGHTTASLEEEDDLRPSTFIITSAFFRPSCRAPRLALLRSCSLTGLHQEVRGDDPIS
ncbi:hypothetical protein NHX12_031468 [Muraenolepis orangiensis]|uniref:Uncharacterized protein n=1 Tax=Muraenolepis orangiensis TaxID=630683 RepID=A0A9Q0E432_9TELE|nr:hypothetical protein NHX12_031468 [Muraenolepis orangiensis]